MGGDITLQSTVGVGSRFDLWLPLKSAPLMPSGARIEPDDSAVPLDEPGSDGGSSVILAIDDDPT